MDAWIRDETEKNAFGDSRLGERLAKLLGNLSQHVGQSIPLACQDWAATKAAYRFLDNPRVDEGAILAGHFRATRERSEKFDGTLLVLHDTSEFSYRRSDADAIGKTRVVQSGHKNDGRQSLHTVCGVLMHASLAVTTNGLPLGLAATAPIKTRPPHSYSPRPNNAYSIKSIRNRLTPSTPPCRTICSQSHGWEDTCHGHTTGRLGTWSSGEASTASSTFTSATVSPKDLWVIDCR